MSAARAPVLVRFAPRAKAVARRQWSEIEPLSGKANWVADALNRLAELGTLGDNWDSYGSQPVQPAAKAAARHLILGIPSDFVPQPHVSAVAGGGIGFHWCIENRDLELEVAPNGDIEFMKTTRADQPDVQEGPWDSARSIALWNWLVAR
jgi:hypothetical protein